MTQFNNSLPECPACDATGVFVGERGGMDHWDCPGCGLTFTTPANRDPPDDDPWDGCEEW